MSIRKLRCYGCCGTRSGSLARSSAAAWRCAAPARCTSNGEPIRACQVPVSAVGEQARDHDRGTVHGSQSPGTAGLDRARRSAVRLLPVRTDHVRHGAAHQEAAPQRRRHRCRHVRQHLPLRHLPANPRRDPQSVGDQDREPDKKTNVSGEETQMSANPLLVSRRAFVGGLVIAISLPACKPAREAGPGELQMVQTQRLAAHRHRRQHHLPVRPLGDGPGGVHLPAHADRRRVGREPGAHPGRVRAAR